ncbi:hypothetical protein RM549_07605 [Salegentibacter sp. F188]|uniref:Uncharacterized protein n=1 Tax=Autumnicola patrickiae TaxID=3075591 RepID=A0ABU3E103_9FLAO|nr:hypothetical protein [Salegentibacter sp. F188]MDT0689646.1 hypothetical protein [Salegentibacter sp. F188]
MKHIYLLFNTILVFSLFTNCGSNKGLQEGAPAQFQDVYTTTASSGLKLHIPVAVIQDNQISLDSVYFRGMKSPLVQNEELSNEYVAQFNTKDSEVVMSSDPREEYGNKAPQRAEKSPFDIERDEAILVFSQNNKTKYFKLTGITDGK